MGRFLSSSGGPPSDSSDSARRQGRRYEALPANGADDDADHEDRESLGTEAVSPIAIAVVVATAAPPVAAAATTITSPVGSGPLHSAAPVQRSSASVASSPAAASIATTSSGITDEQAASTAAATLDAKTSTQTTDSSSSNQHDTASAVEVDASSSMDRKSDTATPTPETESEPDADTTSAEVLEDLGADAIRVRILDLNGKFFPLACRLDWRVARMKQRVLESTDVAVAAQRLIYRGRVLEDDACLADYKVEDGHTIHLFVRHAVPPDPEATAADGGAGASTGPGSAVLGTTRLDDGLTIVHISNDIISSAVFPSDSARRVDPLMLDSPLGNCARRVKLWSSFLLIIYTMKVMGQFALLANDQQLRAQEQQSSGNDTNSAAAAAAARENERERMYDYPEYYHQDPVAGVVELLIHAFGVYVGGVGFKAAHDTDIRPIRFFCRGVVWLAALTVLEHIYVTVQIAHSDIPNERVRFAYGAQAPSKDDIVSANIFQAIMLVIMWIFAIRHAYWHQAEVNAYNESFAVAAMNAVPPAHLPPAEIV